MHDFLGLASASATTSPLWFFFFNDLLLKPLLRLIYRSLFRLVMGLFFVVTNFFRVFRRLFVVFHDICVHFHSKFPFLIFFRFLEGIFALRRPEIWSFCPFWRFLITFWPFLSCIQWFLFFKQLFRNFFAFCFQSFYQLFSFSSFLQK